MQVTVVKKIFKKSLCGGGKSISSRSAYGEPGWAKQTERIERFFKKYLLGGGDRVKWVALRGLTLDEIRVN